MELSKTKFPCCVRAERKFPGIPEHYFLLPTVTWAPSSWKQAHTYTFAQGESGGGQSYTGKNRTRKRRRKKTNILTYRSYKFCLTRPPTQLHILILSLEIIYAFNLIPPLLEHLINPSFTNLFTFILSQCYSYDQDPSIWEANPKHTHISDLLFNVCVCARMWTIHWHSCYDTPKLKPNLVLALLLGLLGFFFFNKLKLQFL